MGKVRARRLPCPTRRAPTRYDALYAHYARLHDHFGRGGDDVMHALRARSGRRAVRVS